MTRTQAIEAAAEAIFDHDVNAVAHFSECSLIQRDFYLRAARSALTAVGYAALLDVAEAAQRVEVLLRAHYRCRVCEKNGYGHTQNCAGLALANAVSRLNPQVLSEGEG